MILDLNDDFFELIEKKNIVYTVLSFIIFQIPQTLLPFVSNKILATPYISKKLQRRGIKRKRIIEISSGFELSKFDSKLSEENKATPVNDGNQNLKIGYFGKIDDNFDINFFVKTLEDFSDKIEVHLYGRMQPGYDLIKTKNSEYYGLVPHEQVASKMLEMDVLSNPFKYNRLANSASPGKVFEYMALSKPTLSADVLSVKGVLQDKENSIIYTASDAESLKEAAEWILNNRDKLTALGKKAREESYKYSWKSIAKTIETEL